MEEIISKDLNPPKLLVETNNQGEPFFQDSEIYWNKEEKLDKKSNLVFMKDYIIDLNPITK